MNNTLTIEDKVFAAIFSVTLFGGIGYIVSLGFALEGLIK